MSEMKTAELLPKLMEILEPLSPEERRRLITASLTLLGDEQTSPLGDPKHIRTGAGEGVTGLASRAQAWMSQNGVSEDELQQVFQIGDGAAEVIASEIPGRNDKERTFNVYILIGISKLLATGSPAFDDKAARLLCKSSGCFTGGNHAAHLASHGNEFTGSKEKGWVLTSPGLKRGAELVKALSKAPQ